ncbi:hypothetical protein H0H87_011011 [Tephrocybe sp. NHM501043]|nr:hypothetical protein H0H87_011011 [Tephrocybe sp. NHM501043]
MNGVPPPVIHIHLKMFDVATGVPIGDTSPLSGSPSQTPDQEKDLSEEKKTFDGWLRGLWQEKDELVTEFLQTNSFRSGGMSPVKIPVRLRRKREVLDAFCFFLPAGAGYLWGKIRQNAVFTNPTPGANPLCGKSEKVTFAELYISALYNSNKCSKVLREKMVETPAFATELAKISLLTNVGRINTTMACEVPMHCDDYVSHIDSLVFPEMKTALRTYHPVPSLQKTNGNAQDAPRIKNCLKAALLPTEIKSTPPSSPDEICEIRPLANVHFDGSLNFLDLFLPNRGLVSADRARAFLWLAYFYLESDEGENPFADEYSHKYPGKAPWLRSMTDHQRKTENLDTNEEMLWGKRMSAQRNAFLQKLVNSLEDDKKARSPPQPAIKGFVSGEFTMTLDNVGPLHALQ